MTGPAVVAIGGGHGLAATIRAVRTYAATTTAVVATADDGGSSGRLREALSVPAPGDIRRCLVAMAGHGRWPSVLDYRFRGGDVGGHAAGNLLLAALAEVTGDFVEACDEVGRLLGLDPGTARVLPATLDQVTLRGWAGAQAVEGQVRISRTEGIERIELVPGDPRVPKAVPAAIADADQVVLGPGSLYTSVLAAAVVPEVRDALAATTARRVYVCNLRAEASETRGYDVAAHVSALRRHGVEVDAVLCHDGALAVGEPGVPVVHAQVTADGGLTHDPGLLGGALRGVLPTPM